MRAYLGPRMVIVDEMGYLPLDDLGATVFFQLVSGRYGRGSVVVVSSKSYSEWGGMVFGDPIIATPILHRLLHHSTTANIRGESYRTQGHLPSGDGLSRSGDG